MNLPHLALTKTCSNCGRQKPLSAFLELTGTQGSTYGNICSSCRKIMIEEAKTKKKETEEGTTSSAGSKVDSKRKTQGDVDKKIFHDEINNLYQEKRKEDALLIKEKSFKTATTVETEKKQREKSYGSFLDRHHTSKNVVSPHNPEAVAEREKETRLTEPFADTQIAGKLKYTSSIFEQFKRAVLGGGSVLGAEDIKKTTKPTGPNNSRGRQ